MSAEDQRTPPIFGEYCRECGSRWHLTVHCWHKDDSLAKIYLSHDGYAMVGGHSNSLDDEDLMAFYIGDHFICGGCLDLSEVSERSNVITCRKCHLRIEIPKRIQTYGDLREHFRVFQQGYQVRTESLEPRQREIVAPDDP